MIDFDAETRRGDFDLAVKFRSDARVTALFGPSGSGKTTVINLIAGVLKPARGRLTVAGDTYFDTEKRLFLPSYRRRVGLVFQDGQLFPHLTVRQNIAYGRWFAPKNPSAKSPIPEDAVIAALGITHLMGRRPAGLSGGERQRVALARALLASPRILLMDEPLASLDHDRKVEIAGLIERIRDEFRIPIVYVSHDRAEVMRLASHVIVLAGGKVIREGKPDAVLPAPQDRLI